MRRITSPRGKAVAIAAFVAALHVAILIADDQPLDRFLVVGVAIALLSLALGRTIGGSALLVPPGVALVWILAGNEITSETGGWIAVWAFIGGAIGLLFALIGTWWYAWSWSGTLTRSS